MLFDEDYAVGKQPCANLKRAPGNIAAAPELANVHECYKLCGKTVSFCENCNKDHHEGGYETCKGKPIDYYAKWQTHCDFCLDCAMYEQGDDQEPCEMGKVILRLFEANVRHAPVE